MTQPTDIRRVALALAATGVPVLPLSRGKRPVANCGNCAGSACGDRPHMRAAGPCQCPRPCHAWAAATIDLDVLASAAWAPAWRAAAAVAYDPGAAGLTVVDLDDAAAIEWARASLPPTRTVTTTRGQHWIYRGTLRSANRVRPGVDIKSRMSYARWLGPGTGEMETLPPAVRALVEEDTTPRPVTACSPTVRLTVDRSGATGCRHTERYVLTGLLRGVELVEARTESGAGSQAYGAASFLAAQHADCPGPCDLDHLAEPLVNAAVSRGVPEPYARRAVTRGLARTGRTA
ncbi:bifunctional DNA primase/polymerase [Streptomyces benahoarensis]|uniref:DNA primase n=1 Tax=Streptomyces benahoarensis TaxID=2595054 RepID=A0A553XW18_9ACTN|nr:bifunctional DNA primase/polymerase [Streptomyces benahoarensis]TSB13363.1 DNA primase [Streptomyces benahoarensis]TSB21119.1 DNA primase [Streptomyces benahoarensis]